MSISNILRFSCVKNRVFSNKPSFLTGGTVILNCRILRTNSCICLPGNSTKVTDLQQIVNCFMLYRFASQTKIEVQWSANNSTATIPAALNTMYQYNWSNTIQHWKEKCKSLYQSWIQIDYTHCLLQCDSEQWKKISITASGVRLWSFGSFARYIWGLRLLRRCEESVC